MLKIECSDLFNEIIQDSLDVGTEMKGKTELNKKYKRNKQKSQVTDIKNESKNTSSDEQKNTFKTLQMDSGEKELHTELDIKTEPQEDENEFPAIAGCSFYDTCSNDNVKVETNRLIIKTEYEDLVDELKQNISNFDGEIKDEKYFPIDLDQDKSGIKTEPTEEEEEGETFLESDEDFNSHESTPNHVCNECNKTFRWKRHLDDHLRIHTGEKPVWMRVFSCEICKKIFSHKSILNRHMLIHSDEKPHSCDMCRKVFSRKSYLDSHRLIHSGVKKFSCDVCKKSFAIKPNLVVHKRIHTGEKPYTCNTCDRAFVQKTDLTRHIRTHTGEKPFSCDICNKSFTQKSILNTHKKIHK